MEKRRIWKIPAAGVIDRLSLQEEHIEKVNARQIRVSVKAVGLNFADIFALAGLYSATPSGSFVPGLEFAGVISVGDNCKFSKGDKVMGVTRFGGYSTIIDVDPDYCQILPDQWSFSQGAAYPVQTLTAWYALKTLGDVRLGQNVLVQSAAGGVGLQAMKICEKLGVNVLGTVGNSDKKTFLARLGFEQIVVRDSEWAEKIFRMLNGKELHLALDAVGGDVQKQCYRMLSPTGRLVVFGAAGFTPGKKRPHYLKMLYQYLTRPKYDSLKMVSENKSVMGFNLIWLWDRRELLLPLLEQIGKLDIQPPYVGHEFPFEQALEALELLRSGLSTGKVVLIVR